ncbi:lytic transglycosylase [Pseudomonas sp.]|uniref:lytic transglycosylase n=1 Tax=Pseudomonas sp. TaxID=306 RepID=UPI003FD80D80
MAAWDNDPIITPAAQVAPSAAIAPPVMGAAPAVPAANPWDNDPIVQAAPKPVAPAVSAPAPVVAQPAPVAAQQLSPIPSPLSSPPAAAPVQDAAPATPEPGFLDKVGNFFTGADRETRATNELPELQNSGLLAGLGMSPAKAAALSATLATTLDPEEMSRILKASSPDIGVEQDEKGNFIVANNKTGAQAVVNKPGVSALDALQLAATAGAYAPSGGAASLVGKGILKSAAAVGAASALTETGLQAAQAAEGGSFDPADVALAGVGGAGGDLVAQGVGAIGKAARSAIAGRKAEGDALVSGYDTAVAGGETPASAAERLVGNVPVPTQQTAAEAVVNATNSSGKAQDKNIGAVLEQVSPDQSVLDAAQRLDLGVDLTPAQFSSSQAYREIEQGLSSLPGSPLNAKQNESYNALAQRADKLITDFGGSTDKARFSDDFRSQGIDTVNRLEQGATNLYGQVSAAIPKDAPAVADNALAHLQARLTTLNGDTSLLTTPEQRAYRALTADPDIGKPLVSTVGLKVPERHVAAAQAVAQDANGLVTDLGGSFDKARFSDTYKAQNLATVERLEKHSDEIFQQINKAIPATYSAPATTTVGFLNNKLDDFGGRSALMSTAERRTLSNLSPKEGDLPGEIVEPTYAALDAVRRQVGAGYKGCGIFAQSDTADLDALYGTLSQDQQRIVDEVSPELGAQFKQGKALIVERKGIERGLKSTIGIDLTGSVANKLSSSLKALSTGDFQAFDRTIANVPDNLKRQAVATALSDVFTGGKGKELNVPALTTWYENMSKNPAAKARLTNLLPAPAVQRLERLYANSKLLQDTVTGKTPDNTLRTPSFISLDSIRRQAESKLKASSFPGEDAQAISGLHSALLSDQQVVADAHGVGDSFKYARELAAKRDVAHGNLTDLLGKELHGAVTSTLGTAVDQLKKGNLRTFDTVMSKIPEDMRQGAVLTALNDAFTSSSHSAQDLATKGFADWYGGISRHAAAKERLLKYLPEEAGKQLEDIYTVAKGMANAAGSKIRTGLITGLLEGYTSANGLLAKVWDVGKQVGTAEGVTSSLGFPGAGTLGVLYKTLSTQKTPIKEAAGKFLASPQFNDAMKAYILAGGAMRANVLARQKQMVRTLIYKKWAAALGDDATARIAAVGPVVYLTEQTKQ